MHIFLPMLTSGIKNLILYAIRIYQKTLSFDHGPLKKVFPYLGCRYHPTCSQYTYEAVDEHGTLKGLYMGTKRVLRCTPFSKGGYDPIPHKK